LLTTITNNAYYENVADQVNSIAHYISETGSYIRGNKGEYSNNTNNKSISHLNHSIDYEPVMLVRTRSNSIFSNASNEDEYDYDITPVSMNSHLTQYMNRNEIYEYSDWNQYGILPSPKYFDKLTETICSLCGRDDENALHYKYFSGYTNECENLGFNICCFCKMKFEVVIKKRAELIWDLLDNKNITYVWAPRTRRDPLTNQRIYDGPYTYEKWRPVSTYVSYMTDNTKGYPGVENTPFILCSIESIYEQNIKKLIPVIDILKSNYNACVTGRYDVTYDPNLDDPVNTLELPPDAKIFLYY